MFIIKKMQQENALEIANNWHYPGIYSFYDFINDPLDYEELISKEKRQDDFFEVLDENKELMGYLTCYFNEQSVEIGLGLRPDLTGHGLGEIFVRRCIRFIKENFNVNKITLKVADFNERAIKVYQRCGFVKENVFSHQIDNELCQFISMSLYIKKKEDMHIIDLHCDTIYAIMNQDEAGLLKNNLQIDLQKLKKGNYMAQCFAMFVNLSKENNPFNKCIDMIKRLTHELAINERLIDFAYSYQDIINNQEKEKLSAIITVEEGEVIEGDIKKLIYLYELGVRMITLTWNFDNAIGFPNINLRNYKKGDSIDFSVPNNKDGLTPFGIEVVKKMNELGMIIDVSHLSDKGFYDVLKYTNKPFLASHSNARAVCNHVRNLTDDMIKELAARRGIMGINYCDAFMSDNKEDGKNTIKHVVKHIKHIYNLVGVDVIALGSDFDGIDPDIELDNASKLPLLINALKQEGFTDFEIDKMTHLNFLRLFKEVAE
ncbi:GNAT family N-acetyltransferase [Acholeplasma sp. OttesenSCG-928-E16]|nr:GNAT family N-acetyltransferase [Acholeplasma sp. OttesenSCG-928-E16]